MSTRKLRGNPNTTNKDVSYTARQRSLHSGNINKVNHKTQRHTLVSLMFYYAWYYETVAKITLL